MTLEVIKGLRTKIANLHQFVGYYSVLFCLTKTMSQSIIDSGEKYRAILILATLVRKCLEMHSTHVVE